MHEAKVDVVTVPSLSEHLTNVATTAQLSARFSYAAAMKSLNNLLLLGDGETWARQRVFIEGFEQIAEFIMNLTDKQAFSAMYFFLKMHWEPNNDFRLGDLLSDMSLLSDGDPADIAIKHEWADAIQFALDGGQAGALTFTEPNK